MKEKIKIIKATDSSLKFKDDRGNLFFDVLRVIKAKRPRIVFLENVKNLVSHDRGKTFKVIEDSLESLEYKVWHQVCNTAEYGRGTDIMYR